jgi:hypothetical protein
MVHFTFDRAGIRDNHLHSNNSSPIPLLMNPRHHPLTLLQASQDSPMLARLIDLNRDSVARLKAIESLLPAPLRPAVKAGPIEGTVWCLLLDNNAAAAKIRQLVPALEAHLRSKGWELGSIRIKVRVTARPQQGV